MLNFIKSRIRFAAQYATRKQLTWVLIGDVTVFTLLSLISAIFVVLNRPVIATTVSLVALAEAASVVFVAHLLRTRKDF